ncbi:hypothetical protein [Methylobacterium indicum]|uniref:Uncharacterized protein n=1 Tax=Methylobacterium indicum TaxID=1775910 RepID=A0A8H8X0L9_9HYPH|nr:hypothetical protein [Methylobacterium indicum]BCM87799.1 hypothetical protein mvi_62600 [Methylobacterium indicum]
MAAADRRIERLISLADQHGSDTDEPDHTVGDLQDMLRAAYAIMSPDQRDLFCSSNAVLSLLDVSDETL